MKRQATVATMDHSNEGLFEAIDGPHLAAGKDGVAVAGVQVGREGGAHQPRRVGIGLHAEADLRGH